MDYIRPGSIAGNSYNKKIKGFADNGGLVLGICNGFQILLESRLLPVHYYKMKILNSNVNILLSVLESVLPSQIHVVKDWL